MERMSGNDECPSGNCGDFLQSTNWILDSGATCHMTPQVLGFIPGLLEDTDKILRLQTYIISQKKRACTHKSV